ncbi:MAG TPA: UDP-N-acetylmuramoyl-L-alanyl-D-glutamate--2,6-diaminopimelate ligase, partial [Solirubrobacteraceae bacterium]|nr:UDP-N-acetylmuramoyl-L-alanyl-D-glutamate--2,6-diaminopimelate ligase [Solirubrobacteraceae bacterium]
DGHDFAAKANAAGAVALLVERPLGLGVPEVEVASVRAAMGPIAARFNGDPTRELKVVGVTGTNGKTTTAYLVRALLEAAGIQTGLLGTVTSIVGGVEWPVERTTAEAIDLEADFRAMLDGGDEACAMEVSSHALALGRTGGIRFAAAVFTNLTQDHLDFHQTMEDYFQAKRRLFLTEPGVSVVNVGDPYGRRLAGEIEGAVTFGVEAAGLEATAGLEADYRATDLRCDASGCEFELRTPAGVREVALKMPGRFNVANAVGALATVHALAEAGRRRSSAAIRVAAEDLDTLIGALERGVKVPGRFEPVDCGQGFGVLVDYAHTPDSLENVLRSARDLTKGRILCVFGAGGDRDRGKRPLMGEIAARLADVAVVTSDNPRSESPEKIVGEILAGIPDGEGLENGSTHVEIDRKAAIEIAIGLARPEDVVVIAGKGHEQGQELAGGVKVPFDDAAVAREVLGARGEQASAGADRT